MSAFHEILPADFEIKPFRLIGKEWMLVAAEKGGKVNAMTASWGGLGVMWAKNVAFIVIRPQRFTKEFIDAAGTFSLNFFDDSYRKTLNYFGAVSGRDEDKITKSGLQVAGSEDAPYFSQANRVLICRTLFTQAYKPEGFVDAGYDSEFYPQKDYHTMYIAEVVRILARD